MNTTIEILPGEKWYGPQVCKGFDYPYGADSDVRIDGTQTGGNQLQPLMLSSEGRYFYADNGFTAHFSDGKIEISCEHGTLDLHDGFGTLRGAFLDARARYFPVNGVLPPEEFFSSPQFNTWIELMYDQNQSDILTYARKIIDNGFRPGILMIDDLWAVDYGKWDFDPSKFPDPKAMMDELHQLGFKVILWICPYVSPDSAEFRALNAKGAFIRDPATGEVRITHWWNGFSAVLDLTNPVDDAWLTGQCDHLIEVYGVDGFKFDAGDSGSYFETDVTKSSVTPAQQSELWARFGARYAYNELRACFKCAELPIVERLSDKRHAWDTTGLGAVIPNSLAQADLGYLYACPDMVGGGEFRDFLPGAKTFDSELYLRYCAAAALLPMIQFSAAPWRVLNDAELAAVQSLMAQREQYLPDIMELVRASAKTGESALHRMEYVFPHEGLSDVNDQFMLGDTILVAPCLEKSATERTVRLPRGTWRAEDGTTYEGDTTIAVVTPFDRVPVLRKI